MLLAIWCFALFCTIFSVGLVVDDEVISVLDSGVTSWRPYINPYSYSTVNLPLYTETIGNAVT